MCQIPFVDMEWQEPHLSMPLFSFFMWICFLCNVDTPHPHYDSKSLKQMDFSVLIGTRGKTCFYSPSLTRSVYQSSDFRQSTCRFRTNSGLFLCGSTPVYQQLKDCWEVSCPLLRNSWCNSVKMKCNVQVMHLLGIKREFTVLLWHCDDPVYHSHWVITAYLQQRPFLISVCWKLCQHVTTNWVMQFVFVLCGYYNKIQ